MFSLGVKHANVCLTSCVTCKFFVSENGIVIMDK